jgi:hypothetical protein
MNKKLNHLMMLRPPRGLKIKTLELKKSTRKNKKYQIKYKGKIIHFGDTRYEHYEDKTHLKLYSHLNHYDEKRRKNYITRVTNIKNKKGELVYLQPTSPAYWSYNYLW